MISKFIYNNFKFYGIFRLRITVFCVATVIWMISIILSFIDNSNVCIVSFLFLTTLIYIMENVCMIMYDSFQTEIKLGYYANTKQKSNS